MKRTAVLAALAVGLLAAGCGSSEDAITADTTCKDYLAQPGGERSDAAIRISSEIAGVRNPGNPMWAMSLDATCGSAPSRTIREAFGGGGSRSDASEEPEPVEADTGGADSEAGTIAFELTDRADGQLTQEAGNALYAALDTTWDGSRGPLQNAFWTAAVSENRVVLDLYMARADDIAEACEAIIDDLGVDGVDDDEGNTIC